MNKLIQRKTTILSFLTITIGAAFLGLTPALQAVSPPPDGGYPGGNTAEGQNALLSLTTGTYNTAVGLFSLLSNTEGNFNTAIGAGTLLANTADSNTAIGAGALLSNTTGDANTAHGRNALFSNTIGFNNTAAGDGALVNNTVDSNNTAVGRVALVSNTEGSQNTANGLNALENNTTGSNNTALGFDAGSGVTTASNVICIGANVAGADADNSCFIGNIRDVQTQNVDGIPVLIDSAGQLGTASSSRRFKKEIQPMDNASEAILALKPVTFHYRSDKTATPQFGLVAEDVAKVDPDLVVRDKNGEIYTVRYDQINAMLLNEFLKEHRAFVEEQQKVARQQREIDLLKAELKEHRSLIQMVSDKVELKSLRSQVADNSR